MFTKKLYKVNNIISHSNYMDCFTKKLSCNGIEWMFLGEIAVTSTVRSYAELLTVAEAGELYTGAGVLVLCKRRTQIYEESKSYRYNAFHFAKEHDRGINS